MSKIFLVSDYHLSHTNTLRYCGRPFFTSKQCDEAIIKRHNSIVSPEDTVYHLGDVAMHTAPIKRILPRLNGKHILVVGNHDLMYPYFLKTRGQKFIDKVTKLYTEAGFSEIHQGSLYLDVNMWSKRAFEECEYNLLKNQKVRLCHFPTKKAYDHYHNDKHDHAKPDDTGILNICGHVHQNWLKRGNNINVGVDVTNFTPVLLEDIAMLWLYGPENIGNPYPIRTGIWKAYHTLMWRFKNLFKNKS